jgi:hypothetical protein
MPVCKCRGCTESVPGGKEVSLSTYKRHKKQPRALQESSSQTIRPHCFCSRYPSGHYLISRSAYRYHRRALESESRELQRVETGFSVDDTYSASIQADGDDQQDVEIDLGDFDNFDISPVGIHAEDYEQQGIENEIEMSGFSGDVISPDDCHDEGVDSDNESNSPDIQLLNRILEGTSDVSDIDSGSLLSSFSSCYH